MRMHQCGQMRGGGKRPPLAILARSPLDLRGAPDAQVAAIAAWLGDRACDLIGDGQERPS
jgi:hypothetical protein